MYRRVLIVLDRTRRVFTYYDSMKSPKDLEMVKGGILNDFTSEAWKLASILYGFANVDVPGEELWEIAVGSAPRQAPGSTDCGVIVAALARNLLSESEMDKKMGKAKMKTLRSELADGLSAESESFMERAGGNTKPAEPSRSEVQVDDSLKEKTYRIPKKKIVRKQQLDPAVPSTSNSPNPGTMPSPVVRPASHVSHAISGHGLRRSLPSDQVIHTNPACEIQEWLERVNGIRSGGVICSGALQRFVDVSYIDKPRKNESVHWLSSTWLAKAVESNYNDPVPQPLRVKETFVVAPYVEGLVW